jgi:hypothetical protein
VIPDFLFSANDDPVLAATAGDTEEASDVRHPIDKFFQDAKCAAALNMGSSGARLIHNLAVESAERDAVLASHYRKIAEAAAKGKPAGDASRLEKRANDPRVVKIQETVIGSQTVVAELDENDVVIRTYWKAA